VWTGQEVSLFLRKNTEYVSLNYGTRFKGPRDRPHRVWYGVWYGLGPPHLPARSFTRYKDALVPRRFSNNSLPLSFPFPLPPFCTVPWCLRPRRAQFTPLPGPLVTTTSSCYRSPPRLDLVQESGWVRRRLRRNQGQWRKCRTLSPCLTQE